MNIVPAKMFMAKIVTETFTKSVRDIVFLLYGSGSQLKEMFQNLLWIPVCFM